MTINSTKNYFLIIADMIYNMAVKLQKIKIKWSFGCWGDGHLDAGVLWVYMCIVAMKKRRQLTLTSSP